MLAVLMLLVQACASTPPTPVTGIEPLVGKWTGTVNIGPSVTTIWLTINPDRTLIATWGSITAQGTVTVSGGRPIRWAAGARGHDDAVRGQG